MKQAAETMTTHGVGDMGDRIFNIGFYLAAPVGVAAAVYNDSPWLACFLAFALGNLFQIDIRAMTATKPSEEPVKNQLTDNREQWSRFADKLKAANDEVLSGCLKKPCVHDLGGGEFLAVD